MLDGWRTCFGTPRSLTSLQQRLVKTGGGLGFFTPAQGTIHLSRREKSPCEPDHFHPALSFPCVPSLSCSAGFGAGMGPRTLARPAFLLPPFAHDLPAAPSQPAGR